MDPQTYIHTFKLWTLVNLIQQYMINDKPIQTAATLKPIIKICLLATQWTFHKCDNAASLFVLLFMFYWDL